MASLTGISEKKFLEDWEKAVRKERNWRQAVRELLARIPRCDCGTPARYQLPDGSLVCVRCAIDEDRDAAEQDLLWARAAMRLDCIAAEWAADERQGSMAPEDVYAVCHRAAAERLKLELRESLWGIGEGMATIYDAAGFRTDIGESLDEVIGLLASRYALVFEVYAAARYNLPLEPDRGTVVWAVMRLIGGEDAVARMRRAWGKDKDN